jgi:hypothetical protein
MPRGWLGFVLLASERNLNGKNGMLKRLGLGLLFAVGIAGAAAAQGWTRFDGQYVGELTLAGVVSGECMHPPPGSAYPMTIAGGQVRFKYVPRFDTTLIGRVDQNGNFKAARQLKRGWVSMTGHVDANGVTASIVSPSCNYNFQSHQ